MKTRTLYSILILGLLSLQLKLVADDLNISDQTNEQCWAYGRVWDYSSLEGYHFIIRPETMIPTIEANLDDWIDIKSVVSNFPLHHMMLIKFGYRPLGPKDPYGFLPVDITCIEEVKDTCGVAISYSPVSEYSMPVSNPQLIPYFINAYYSFGTQIENFQWNFGASGTNIYHPDIHYFIGEDDYTVCVTATHEGGCVSQACTTLHAQLFPVSECESSCYFDPVNDTINCLSAFGFTVSESQPVTYFFRDNSKGNIESWLWDFGDGTFSNEQNPSHNYLDTISNYDFGKIDSEVFNSNPDSIYENFVKSSAHTVTLTVVNKKHHASKLKKIIYESNLCWFRTPNIFSVDSISPMSYRFVSFSDDDDNGEMNKWDFGDGTEGIECCPEHTYRNAGNYVVHLTNYTNDLGYEYFYSLKVTGQNGTGINVPDIDEVNFYPNPVSGILYFEGLENGGSNVVIVSIDGKLRKEINGECIREVRTEDLPAGVYILRIVKGDCLIRKILIKK